MKGIWMRSARGARFTRAGGTRIGDWVCLLTVAAAFLLAASPLVASVESELAFHRGVVAFGGGELDEAREQFQIVLAEDPEDTAAIHYLGLITDAEGKPDEAIELFRRALALTPDDTDLRFDLGTALLEAGRNQEALEVFDEVLEREPDRARAHLFAGIAEYRLRDYSAAIPRSPTRATSRPRQALSESWRGSLRRIPWGARRASCANSCGPRRPDDPGSSRSPAASSSTAIRRWWGLASPWARRRTFAPCCACARAIACTTRSISDSPRDTTDT
jgi:tetratricopeptide (TPR) repeat protein